MNPSPLPSPDEDSFFVTVGISTAHTAVLRALRNYLRPGLVGHAGFNLLRCITPYHHRINPLFISSISPLSPPSAPTTCQYAT